MSRWTHIVATIYVDTCETKNNIESYVKRKVKEAPTIIGSEEDACCFINKMPGFNYIDLDTSKEFQSSVIITIVGDLRNKTYKDVKKDYEKFLEYLLNFNWIVRDNVCLINDEYLKKPKLITYDIEKIGEMK